MPRFLPLLTAVLSATAAAQPAAVAPAALTPVVVTATRAAQDSFDFPVSIDQLSASLIRADQPLVNLSESLMRVPGIAALNRQNYAQDMQLSSRGFGARASFGVRGVRIYVDGIPATMPDGQGQVSHIDLASLDRIEVMRGPFSALYGNSSGGVIAAFTESGKPGRALEADAAAGSDAGARIGLKASGQRERINHVISGARFVTDGYRLHSAANRSNANAKLRIALSNDTSFSVVGNAVQMRDVEDPLGLTRAQLETNPRGADTAALIFNTRKSLDQQQIGLSLERELDQSASLHATVYGGRRLTRQFLAIPVAAQTPATSAGGMVDLVRRYAGIDLRWTQNGQLFGTSMQWTAGISYDALDEDRRGYENFSGGTLGVQGRLRRDEFNRVFNLDQYLQAQWEPNADWLVAAGVRNSRVAVRSLDHYVVPGNGDDSGSVGYRAFNPVLGARYKFGSRLNLYASYGKGFETPTLNELSYRSTAGTNTGLNFGLLPAKSEHLEIGAKARLGGQGLATLALFRIGTRNELTVLSSAGGRAVYRNAGSTQRQGIEMRYENQWHNGLGLQLAYSWLRAEYADAFCGGPCSAATQVIPGNRMPGVPQQSTFAELSWRHEASGLHAALEARHVGRIFVDDVNSDAAPSYLIFNLRGGYAIQAGPWQWKLFARADNLGRRRYAGSVIVNESNRRTFEPAPGRNFLAGTSFAYRW